MITFSSWLFVLSGMLLVDTVLCAAYLKRFSESFLEATVTALVWVVARLLQRDPIAKLDTGIFPYLIVATVVVAMCAMFYHLIKIVTTGPNRKKRDNKTPAHRERED